MLFTSAAKEVIDHNKGMEKIMIAITIFLLNLQSSILNPPSPWLSSHERFGHLAKSCDLTISFGKFILL
jgi:hypothetical protein